MNLRSLLILLLIPILSSACASGDLISSEYEPGIHTIYCVGFCAIPQNQLDIDPEEDPEESESKENLL